MKSQSQKIPAIILMLLIAVPILLPLVYEFQKWEIKKHMFELIKKTELQTVLVPAQDVVWMDKHEIWINEQMFDIASVQIRDGIYTFTGMYDSEETEVVKKQMQPTQTGKEQQQLLGHILKLILAPCIHPEVFQGNTNISVPVLSPHWTASLMRTLKEIATPPPRLHRNHIA